MSRTPGQQLRRGATKPSAWRVLLAFALAAVVAVPALVLAESGPAFAAGSVSLSKSTGIAAAGETITVSGSGFDSTRGIYGMFCKQPAGALGTAAGRPTGADCSSTQFWITQPVGGSQPTGTTAWTGDGTFELSFPVASTFKSIDCRAAGTVCGIVTRNDHTQPGVYDQDTFTPISFAANPAVTLSKSTGIVAAGETITVNGSGFDSNRGIYGMFCKQAAGTVGTAGGRPTGADCSSTQFWITQPVGGSQPAGTTAWTGAGTFQLSFPVASTFKSIDCRATGTVCGIVTRNDHTQPGRYDADSFTPISFAADPVTNTVTLSKSTGLTATGETITVNGTGFDSSRGIYGMFCKQPAGALGTAAGRPTGADCSSTQFWITQPVGGSQPAGTTAWTGAGTFQLSFPVASTFKTVDCRAAGTVCGIVTRNDHTQPGVYDQDTFTPVTFAPDPVTNTVTLSKSTDLVAAGETITVNGTGFDSSRGIYGMFCKQASGTLGTSAGRPTGADCSSTQFWITQPVGGSQPAGTTAWTGAGTFQLSFPVASTFKSIDCRAAGTVCGIVTRNDHTQPGVYDQDTFTPVTFAADPDPEPTGPQVTVTPTTGLDAAGDTVTVAGTGFPDDQGIYVRLCQAPTGTVGTAAGRPAAGVCDGQGLWVTPDPPAGAPLPEITDGAFSVDLDVAGAFAGDPDAIDCMTAGSCGVFIRRDHVGGAADYALDSFTPLTFDPSTTPPVIEEPEEPSLNDVTVTLSQSTDLANGQVITVDGADFVADQGVYVQFCAAPTGQLGTAAGRATSCYPEQDGTHTVWVAPVSSDGTFTTPLTVVSSFTDASSNAVDCTVDAACGVFVRRDHNGGTTDYSQDAFVPVSFGDGTVEPGPDPTVGASKTTDLDPAGDVITVGGANFVPGTELFVALCDSSVPNFAACDFDNVQEVTAAVGADRAVGDPGTFEVDLDVRAAFGEVDCLADGATCAVQTWAVSGGDGSEEVTLPVSFAAAGPSTGGTTTTTAAPGTGDGTTVTPVDSGTLARTGSQVGALALSGLLAIVIGGAFLAISRRRTTTA